MKKDSQQKVPERIQTVYMRMLQSLRSSLTSDYSKVLREETRGMVLGYD